MFVTFISSSQMKNIYFMRGEACGLSNTNTNTNNLFSIKHFNNAYSHNRHENMSGQTVKGHQSILDLHKIPLGIKLNCISITCIMFILY